MADFHMPEPVVGVAGGIPAITAGAGAKVLLLYDTLTVRVATLLTHATDNGHTDNVSNLLIMSSQKDALQGVGHPFAC